jgi:hypothetical protein
MFLLYVYQDDYNMSDDTIQSESISQLFLGKNFGFLATPIDDDSPHVTPVWVDLANGHIIVNTDEGRLK